jgi:hypothetical protein
MSFMRVHPALPIACTALLASSAMLVRGPSCGHDFDFHLLSWLEVARAWHAGLIYPHWVQDANFGAGEPRLIFYPPASWFLGAALGVLTRWQVAPALFVLVALLAAGCGMYLLAREWSSASAATVAACLYIANPYAMFVAYERTAFGELLAAAWLPLMVLFALRRKSSVGPLGLAVAALWLTNSPAAVIGSYLLAVLAAAMCIAEKKTWPALRAAGGVALGLSLAAFYIVPAAYEQRWVQIQRAITPGMRVEDSFLFAHTADVFHDQVLRTASWIFVLEFAVAAALAWVAWSLVGKQSAAGSRPVCAVLASTLPILLFLQFPWSDWVWKLTPHLKFLQFPWRWLMALSVVGCALTAMALVRKRSKLMIACMIAVIAISGGFFFFQHCDEEDAVAPQLAAFQTGEGTQGTDEYTPAGADNASVQQDLPLVRVLRSAQDDTVDSTDGENPEWKPLAHGSVASTFRVKHQDGEHWTVDVANGDAGYAVLRLMDYPAWRVLVDGVPEPGRPARMDGLMAVPLAPGNHVLDVQWTATRDMAAGRTISLIALLTLGLVTVKERRGRV